MCEEGRGGPSGARKMESLRPALPRLDLVARETRFPTWFLGCFDFLLMLAVCWFSLSGFLQAITMVAMISSGKGGAFFEKMKNDLPRYDLAPVAWAASLREWALTTLFQPNLAHTAVLRG